MSRILLSVVGALALIAGMASVAQADSFRGGVQLWPNGQLRGLEFGYDDKGRYGPGYGRYERHPRGYYLPVPPPRIDTIIVTEPCIAGYTLINGQCVRVRRIR